MNPILTDEQREVYRWYWTERRLITEIMSWINASRPSVKQKLRDIRNRFAAVGIELEYFSDGKHDREAPPLHEIPLV